jgi:predicted small secreted protein
MNRKNIVLVLFVLISVLLTACTTPFSAGRSTQSHFTYPNSNVTPLANAEGSSTTITDILFIPLFPNLGNMIEEAIQKAVKSRGGDLLIDYQTVGYTTSYLLFSTMTIGVRGTAAKMEIGKQELK